MNEHMVIPLEKQGATEFREDKAKEEKRRISNAPPKIYKKIISK